ncbi:hypothetical protein ACFV4F_10285 [Kitasatospora sp. NPDC059722]|uniref:hypothetical protein n=1 Tax=Kitasatospora sp. NPDC059722 TaxID=3346925 RepID=UPI0036AA28DB
MRRIRTLAVCLTSAALLGAPLAFGPAAQAAEGCAKANVCLYSGKGGRGAIVWQGPLSQLRGSDITGITPSVQAKSVRTPLPAGEDCAVGLFPERDLGGEAKWANGPLANLTAPGSTQPVTVASAYVDCG